MLLPPCYRSSRSRISAAFNRARRYSSRFSYRASTSARFLLTSSISLCTCLSSPRPATALTDDPPPSAVEPPLAIWVELPQPARGKCGLLRDGVRLGATGYASACAYVCAGETVRPDGFDVVVRGVVGGRDMSVGTCLGAGPGDA